MGMNSSEESRESCSHPGSFSQEFTTNAAPIEKGGTAARAPGTVHLHHGGASGERCLNVRGAIKTNFQRNLGSCPNPKFLSNFSKTKCKCNNFGFQWHLCPVAEMAVKTL